MKKAAFSMNRGRDMAAELRCFKMFLLAACISFLAGCLGDEDSARNGYDLLETAWLKFNIGEYGQAMKLFQRAADSQDSRISLYGRYGMGMTCALSQTGADKEKALRIFEGIANDAPKSEIASWSLLAIARQKQLVGPDMVPDYPEVRKAYQNLIDRFPDTPAAEEGFLYQQATYLVSLSREEAKIALVNLSRFVREKPSSQFASYAWSLVARCHETLKDQPAQLDALKKSLETQIVDPNDPYTDNSSLLWNIATLAEFGTGDFDMAREFYRRLMAEYPQDVRNFSAKLALERMDRTEARFRNELAEKARGGGR